MESTVTLTAAQRYERPLRIGEFGILAASTVMSGLAALLYVTAVAGKVTRLAVLAGFGWGIAIGILDFTLLAAPKQKNWVARTLPILPRAVLAYFAGALVAMSLILAIHHREVTARLASDHAAALAVVQQEAEKAHARDADAEVARATEAQAAVDKVSAEVTDLDKRAQTEAYGGPGSSGRVGTGKVYNQIKAQLDAADLRKLDADAALKQAITARDAALREKADRMAADVATRTADITNDTGPLAQERALNELLEESPSLKAQVKNLTWALILFDLAPALFALFGRRTHRDRAHLAADAAAGVLAEKEAAETQESPALAAARAKSLAARAEVAEAFTEAHKSQGLAAAAATRDEKARPVRRRRPARVAGAAVVALLVSTTPTLFHWAGNRGTEPGATNGREVARTGGVTAAAAEPEEVGGRPGVLAAAQAKPGTDPFCAELANSSALRDLRAADLGDEARASRIAKRAAKALDDLEPPTSLNKVAFRSSADALNRYADDPAAEASLTAASAALKTLGREVQPLCEFPLG